MTTPAHRRWSVCVRAAAPPLIAVLALAGCGGGDATHAAAAPRAQALAGARPADAQAASQPIDTAALFDWAQRQYPGLFPPGATNQPFSYEGVTYTIRFYPGTGNYLGVSGGRVYGYGAFTGNQLQGFGLTADYTCSAAPQNCLPATGVALAWDGAGKAWDGSDWQ